MVTNHLFVSEHSKYYLSRVSHTKVTLLYVNCTIQNVTQKPQSEVTIFSTIFTVIGLVLLTPRIVAPVKTVRRQTYFLL